MTGATVRAYDPAAGEAAAQTAPRARGGRRRLRRLRRAPTCSACSPSGTSSAGSTSSGSRRSWPRRAIVDARNLLDPAAMRQPRVPRTGASDADGPHRRHRRRRVRRLAPVSRAARRRPRGRRASTTCRRGSRGHVDASPRRTAASRSSSTTSSRVAVDGPVDAVMHLASAASAPEYLRGRSRRCGWVRRARATPSTSPASARRPVPPRVDERDLRRPARASAARESYWGNVNPVGPRAVYDEAKRYAEALTMAYHRTHGVDTEDRAHLQLPTGPACARRRAGRVELPRAGDGGRAAHRLRRRAARPGRSATSTTRSGGCSRCSTPTGIGPMNIGNPEEHTILELAELVLEITGSRSELRFVDLPVDDPTRRCPDISQACAGARLVAAGPAAHRRRAHVRAESPRRPTCEAAARAELQVASGMALRAAGARRRARPPSRDEGGRPRRRRGNPAAAADVHDAEAAAADRESAVPRAPARLARRPRRRRGRAVDGLPARRVPSSTSPTTARSPTPSGDISAALRGRGAEPLGTAGAIRFAAEGVRERFIVCNGDVLTSLDLGAMVALPREQRRGGDDRTRRRSEDP